MAESVEAGAICWRTGADEFEGADPNKVLSFSPASTSKDLALAAWRQRMVAVAQQDDMQVQCLVL